MSEAEEEAGRAEVFHGERYAPETITREAEVRFVDDKTVLPHKWEPMRSSSRCVRCPFDRDDSIHPKATREAETSLKPCSFCRWEKNHRRGWDNGRGAYVQCDCCLSMVFGPTQADADSLWNTRTTPTTADITRLAKVTSNISAIAQSIALRLARNDLLTIEKMRSAVEQILLDSDLYASEVQDACKELGSLERNEVNFQRGLTRGYEQARRDAAKVADGWARSPSCSEPHEDNPCCHIRTGAGIADAIRRSLVPNESTEEVSGAK